jgi:hypothetical protein
LASQPAGAYAETVAQFPPSLKVLTTPGIADPIVWDDRLVDFFELQDIR